MFYHSLTFEIDYNPKVAKTLKLIYNHYLMQESAICFDCGPLNKVLGHSDHTFNKTKILKLQLNIVVKKTNQRAGLACGPYLTLPTIGLNQGCTTQISWRAKKQFLLTFWPYYGPNWYIFYHFKGAFINKTSVNHNSLGLAGQIKSFRGPYVGHAWSIFYIKVYRIL